MFRLPTPRLLSGLKSALRPAMPRFKVSAFWLLILAWIFLLVWIWWKGPTWTLYEEQWLKPLANRWLATAAWGIIALVWLTVRVMKRLQQLEKMQKQQREEAIDPLSVELNAQQRYLDRWLLRLQRHLDNRRFLWQLPWYMVIGPAGSGKTTLLREGFPSDIIYAPEGARGTEQRLYLTPHVGKQAVIFDIDGTLCAPADADILHRRLWEHALGWLKEKRARQPLNGIILTLDLPDLLTADKRRREHLLQTLRSRLQDIRQHLHCQLPVYVVLTRLDLLQGFAALFQSLNRQDRDAILGVTFTRRAHENDDWRTELNAFWQTWVDRMNLALPDLMVAQTHTRASLFSFSRQMQGSREPLVSLLEGLLDGENMNVMLRGVYLTSSLQRGQMDDIFTQSAARQYRLGNNPLASWPLVDTAPYFTRSLFPQALLAEPNLATESRAWLMRSRRRLTVFSTTGGVAALLLITGWHHYYNGNYQSGITVLKQAKAFMDVPPPQGEDDYGNLQLPLLNPVRDATLAYGDWGDRSRLADMGLYQGRRIGPYVEQTYLQLLEQRYLPSLFNGLVKAMNAAPPESEEKLAVLRVMRMLEDKTGNILRQQISFAESDLPLIYRTERALQLICDKLQQVELKRVPRVENLLYFMQNTRKRLEPQLKSNTENAAKTTVRTLIYAPETQASSTPEAVVPPLPGLPEMKVEVRSLTENPPQASVIKQGSTVRGFIAGIACSVAVASALWWWQVYPVQQQLLQVNDTAQGAATVWMASPELENYERRLQQLLDTSPVQPLETGMQMMRVADSRWPESLQQQQASTQWNEALKTRAQNSPQLRGWLQTRQDLHAFADLVMQREKEGLTLSYIKNVIWQAERGLGQETPVESLLTQYQDARAQKQNTDALEKQINERLEGVLSRWLLLNNNTIPTIKKGIEFQ